MGLEEVKAVVGEPEGEKPKKKFLKGMAETPGDLRLAFSIPADRLREGQELDLLDRNLKEMARLLHLAALDDTIAIQLLGNLRQMNDTYCSALGHPTEIYPE
jgi:hypothetical protein